MMAVILLYAGIAKRAAKWAHILAETTVLCKKPLQRLRFWRRYAIITYNVCIYPAYNTDNAAAQAAKKQKKELMVLQWTMAVVYL